MNESSIGLYIQILRQQKNLTQQQLADQLGVTNRAVSKWERCEGLPDISLLLALAGALDTTVDALLRGGPEIPANTQPDSQEETPVPEEETEEAPPPEDLPASPEPVEPSAPTMTRFLIWFAAAVGCILLHMFTTFWCPAPLFYLEVLCDLSAAVGLCYWYVQLQHREEEWSVSFALFPWMRRCANRLNALLLLWDNSPEAPSEDSDAQLNTLLFLCGAIVLFSILAVAAFFFHLTLMAVHPELFPLSVAPLLLLAEASYIFYQVSLRCLRRQKAAVCSNS